jgi:hypothetical protein
VPANDRPTVGELLVDSDASQKTFFEACRDDIVLATGARDNEPAFGMSSTCCASENGPGDGHCQQAPSGTSGGSRK